MNRIFLFVLRRGMKKRLNDVLSGSYFGASLNKDAMNFTQSLVRNEWDGNEKSLPHYPGCPCLSQSQDGKFFNRPCSCGMTALAHGQYWKALKQSICFWFLKIESEAKEHESLLSGSVEQILDPQLRTLSIAALRDVLFQRHNSMHRLYFPFERDSYIQISFSRQELSQLIASRSESPHGEHQ